MLRQGGPVLPYNVIAGVVPCRRGWLVVSCKIAGVTLSVEEPTYFDSFVEVLDYKPAFSIVGVHAPIGYLDEATPGGRTCDREVRALLGPRRGASIRSAPSRALLRGEVGAGTGVDAVTLLLLPHYREIVEEVPAYRQRTVYEVEPELTFYELNESTPLKFPKQTELGRVERRTLLEARVQGVERIFESELDRVKPSHLIDAAACMWSARRIFGKIGFRIPQDPEWDSEGIRMEIIC
jgi:predicted RNase H-like nuclease